MPLFWAWYSKLRCKSDVTWLVAPEYGYQSEYGEYHDCSWLYQFDFAHLVESQLHEECVLESNRLTKFESLHSRAEKDLWANHQTYGNIQERDEQFFHTLGIAVDYFESLDEHSQVHDHEISLDWSLSLEDCCCSCCCGCSFTDLCREIVVSDLESLPILICHWRSSWRCIEQSREMSYSNAVDRDLHSYSHFYLLMRTKELQSP